MDTDSVDDETDVNSADLQGFVRSELEALSAGIDDFPSDLSSVFTQEESSKLENVAMDFVFCPGSVGDHPCSPRQDERQERRQGRTCRLIFWKVQGKVAKTQLSQAFAVQVGCEKVEINVSRVWTTWS